MKHRKRNNKTSLSIKMYKQIKISRRKNKKKKKQTKPKIIKLLAEKNKNRFRYLTKENLLIKEISLSTGQGRFSNTLLMIIFCLIKGKIWNNQGMEIVLLQDLRAWRIPFLKIISHLKLLSLYITQFNNFYQIKRLNKQKSHRSHLKTSVKLQRLKLA